MHFIHILCIYNNIINILTIHYHILFLPLETSEFEDRCRLSVKTKSKGEEATEFAKLSRPPNNKVWF